MRTGTWFPSRSIHTRHLLPILAAMLIVPGCSDESNDGGELSDCEEPEGTIELPVAPESVRVDMEVPVFSNPSSVTNPLLPAGVVESVILLGTVEGESFRAEVTLLPETRTIRWKEQDLEAVESQYAAFVDGRLQEIALDWYAQADDGAVWYLGEDVFNYEDGEVADTEGTWLTCRDGPPGMIMPGHPEIGDVYRPENLYPDIFEEVTVESVDVVVNGPAGPVNGAIAVRELHLEGTYETKTFAPGYGEFFTGGGGDVEALALAVPTDELPGKPPAELEMLVTGADQIFETAATGDWTAVAATLATMNSAWGTYRSGGVPPLLETQMEDALSSLDDAVSAEDAEETRHASIEVGRASHDFRLRYRPATDIDQARFDLWLRQVAVDADADDGPGVLGDAATLEWTFDRFRHVLSSGLAAEIDSGLEDLRDAAESGNLEGAADLAADLRALLAGEAAR